MLSKNSSFNAYRETRPARVLLRNGFLKAKSLVSYSNQRIELKYIHFTKKKIVRQYPRTKASNI